MKEKFNLTDIGIRTELRPGDLGYIIYMHGRLYHKEQGYGLSFENYVATSLFEFYENYNSKKDRVWVCEHNDQIIGFLALMNRGESAQLRYFILKPAYRGIGLGNRLMNLYMNHLKKSGYTSSYLWTAHELDPAAHLYIKNGFSLTEEKESNRFGKPLMEQRYDLRIV